MNAEDLLRQSINRHRDDPSPRLDWSIPIDRLVDIEYCNSTQDELARVGVAEWMRRPATETTWRSLPRETGLYMFVWEPALEFAVGAASSRKPIFVLYVGRAGGQGSRSTLQDRYRSEYSSYLSDEPEKLWSIGTVSDRHSRLSRFLNLRPLYIYYAAVQDDTALVALEERLYNLFSPPLNTSGSPRLRPTGKPKKAF